MFRKLLPGFAALLLLGTGGCHRPTHTNPNAFAWSGTIPDGGWLRLRNVTGSITVEPTTGSTASVQAIARWRGRRMPPVDFAQVRAGNDVVICTMYGDEGNCGKEYEPGKGRRSHFSLFGMGDNASVQYIVRLPTGVRIDAGTVTGAVRVASNGGDVQAHTVNGSVSVASSSGAVDAESVNGSVKVSLDSLGAPGAIHLSTVNGSVVAELPAALGATLSMETVNGSLTSDFPVATSGSTDKHELHGTVGSGGREVKLSTVNGSVKLLRKG
ncbi:MAG TPA: DUF4097 family beta strand repeat-containing protein [Gemmatimonadaceae bacterium]